MPIDAREHYVYALYREDGVTPFYIGMGKDGRWLDHEQGNTRAKGSVHKRRVIAKMLAAGITPIPKAKLAEGLTEKEAAALERKLIAEIGRWPDGPLTNMTSGGDGIFDLPEESRSRQLLAARNKTAQHRERLRRAALLAWSDPQIAERQRIASAAAVKHPEIRAKIARNHPTKHWSDEAREAFRARLQASWDDPDKRASRLARLRATWTPEKFAARTAKTRATLARKAAQKTEPPRENGS